MSTVIDLGRLGSRGFVIEGDAAFDSAGASISGAGDVNSDGFDDIIIGAYGNDAGGSNAGAAYVIFGKAGGFGALDLGNLQPSDGFKIQGDEADDWAGWAVSGAGDVNGDGFDDIIVGADSYDGYTSTAHAYVIFGKASGFATIDLTGLAASDGFVISGQSVTWSTFSTAGAGDVNGDGFDDVIIGSSYDNGMAGAAYVIFGKASGFGAIDLANIAPGAGFEIEGDAASDQAGHSVAAAGDVNGDGFDDLILGAPPGFYGVGSGAEAYVIFGKATGFSTIDLTNLAATAGFAIQGDNAGKWAGSVVSGAGDVNGDGFDDVIVGAKSGSRGGVDAGEAYVIFGKASGFATVDLANLGAAGFIIQGDIGGDWFADSLSAAGDVNGDGFDDLIIGATYGDNGAHHAGEAYVIFGKAGISGTLDLTNFTSADGFIIEGDAEEARVASSVAGAGDIDGDGFDDLLVGNPLSFHGVNHDGRVYVISGNGAFDHVRNDFNGDGRSDILWRHNDGTFGDWLGQANGGFLYNAAAGLIQISTDWSIAATADFNGDGRSDILWRHDNGDVGDWLATTNGGFAYNAAAGITPVSTDWNIFGSGDFNGDGRDDILWRHDDGAFGNWLGRADGGFFINDSGGLTQASTAWHIAGTGDFNGDGRDDILWRHDDGTFGDWLGQADGGFAYNAAAGVIQVSTDWHIVDTGDFNGDGRDDILWRHDNGAVGDWLATANGGFAYNAAAGVTPVPNDWHIAGTGDFNGDRYDDILWRHDNGAISDWLGTASGGFVGNDGAAYQHVPTDWRIQPHNVLPIWDY